MDGKEAIKALAKRLLEAAGGNPAKASEYYAVICGGADDIVGMTITDNQLKCWGNLGEPGALIYLQLALHANDKPPAYGMHCYEEETIRDILRMTAAYPEKAINEAIEATKVFRCHRIVT